MVPLRKERAGSCNLGYTWPHDGSVVEVTPEHAQLLLAVPDGDFTAVAAAPSAETQAEPDSGSADRAIEEPAAAEFSEAPPPRKPAAKRTTAKKSVAEPEPASPVEE